MSVTEAVCFPFVFYKNCLLSSLAESAAKPLSLTLPKYLFKFSQITLTEAGLYLVFIVSNKPTCFLILQQVFSTTVAYYRDFAPLFKDDQNCLKVSVQGCLC